MNTKKCFIVQKNEYMNLVYVQPVQIPQWLGTITHIPISKYTIIINCTQQDSNFCKKFISHK